MKQINLLTVPNQTLSFTILNNSWRIRIYSAIDRLLMDFILNQQALCSSVLCDTGKLMIPYRYLYHGIGNFMFIGKVDYEIFDKDCLLYYLTDEEVKTFDQTLNRQFYQMLSFLNK